MYNKGIRYFITRDDLYEHKYDLKEGHISDTEYSKYTRHIPKRIIKKKKSLEKIFDRFIIFHYYNENQSDTKKMTKQEKEDMKDPILFGMINGVDKLYYIDDWTDEYCDLTIDKLLDLMDLDEDDRVIEKHPDFFDKEESK